MSRKNNIFFTSDWHVGHAKSIEYDARPFNSLNHMHSVLINNYNSCVRPEDFCYFLGDMGLTKSDTLSGVVHSLQGTKILILGNHDKGPQAMLDVGFDMVLYGARLVIAGESVTLSHCPLLGIHREDVTGMRGVDSKENWHGESKHSRLSFPDMNQFHLHGHIHSRPGKTKSQPILGKQFDVGVPANGYRPVSISTIESWIAKYKR